MDIQTQAPIGPHYTEHVFSYDLSLDSHLKSTSLKFPHIPRMSDCLA